MTRTRLAWTGQRPVLSFLVVTLYLTLLFWSSTPNAFASPGFDTFINYRGGNSSIYPHSGYDYSPTLMRDTNGRFRMWWCGQKASTVNNPPYVDNLVTADSASLDSGWTNFATVLTPATGSHFDSGELCDPSVVRVNGTYYMYYEGIPTFTSTENQIGVASSSDGITFSRLNGGNPIVSPHASGSGYGAGYASVSFLDGWYYMSYYDKSGADGLYHIYVMRSTDPLFPANSSVTQEVRNDGGVVGFYPYSSILHTTYSVLRLIGGDMVNADLKYVGSLGMWSLSNDGDTGFSRTDVFFFNKTFSQYLGVAAVAGTWSQGPALLASPWGVTIPNRLSNQFANECNVPLDLVRTPNQSNVELWELAHSGEDLLVSGTCPRGVTYFDYDLDGIDDPVIYRPSSNAFYVRESTLGGVGPVGTGAASAIPIKGDFDGDSKTDYGYVVPVAGGYLDWHINYSHGGSRYQPTWGLTTDKIAIADYNNDGKDDIAVFRAGAWWIVYDTGAVANPTFGGAGDIPVPADYDGDGLIDLAVFNSGSWSIKNSSNGATVNASFGLSGDIPMSGDYFADGRSSLTVWRPGSGYWYSYSLKQATSQSLQWGLTGDVPVSGDFDGDGQLDYVVWRPTDGNWYINNRFGYTKTIQWGGLAGDVVPTNR